MKKAIPSPDSGQPRCKKCGRLLIRSREADLCDACADQELFVRVREYIRENDVRDYEVAEHFDIPVAKVRNWVKEGRIQYKGGDSPKEFIVANYCQICGSATEFGTICPECMMDQNRKSRKAYSVIDPSADTNSRMRFIDKEREGRK